MEVEQVAVQSKPDLAAHAGDITQAAGQKRDTRKEATCNQHRAQASLQNASSPATGTLVLHTGSTWLSSGLCASVHPLE